MQKWEYILFLRGGSERNQAELNRLGAEGWELVAIDDRFLYLKRPISN